MNNTESVACGVTIFHKKADGTVTGEMIDFSNAVLNNVNAGTAENPIGVLGYGKTFSVNPVSFDEAGHAKGTSASGIVSYALPKVISSEDDYNTAVAKQEILNQGFNNTVAEELNTLIQDYPLSAKVLLPSHVELISDMADVLEDVNDLTDIVVGADGSSGLVGQVDEIDDIIDNTILPALNLTTGIVKPGIEFVNQSSGNNVVYKSPINGTNLAAGDHATVFNYYDMESANDSSAIENTNYAVGKYSMAEGIDTRAIGKFSHAENGFRNETDTTAITYPTIAAGDSSHAEGRGGLGYNINQTEIRRRETVIDVTNDITISGTTGTVTINASDDAFRQIKDLIKNFHSPSVGGATRDFANQCYIGITTTTNDYIICPIETLANFNDTSAGSFTFKVPDGTTIGDSKTFELYCGAAYGQAAHSEGYGTSARGDHSHSEGKGSASVGKGSHAEGYFTLATGDYAHAEGGSILDTTAIFVEAKGEYSHAEGSGTLAENKASHAEGLKSRAQGEGSHSEGKASKASGEGSHAEGIETEASKIGSHAEGYKTIASGDYSHAEGEMTQATGKGAHAEGGYDGVNKTTASGIYSHAEGQFTQAIGNASHSEGINTQAKGMGSHAGGYETRANRDYQTVVGYCNANDSNSLFIVGAGTGTSETERINSFSVTNRGTIILPIWENNEGYYSLTGKYGEFAATASGIVCVNDNYELNNS